MSIAGNRHEPCRRFAVTRRDLSPLSGRAEKSRGAGAALAASEPFRG
ncbi:hypothetical protein F11_07115 [Rhodospirillum rubrum F11]|nr:hypothetical protein F11_07115 [Rhodospirillum rubrum F11]